MKRAITTQSAPGAIGPYSQAIATPITGRMIFCSGQIALDPVSGEMIGAGDVKAQTERVMKNLSAVLQAAGATTANVTRTTIFLSTMQDFTAVNEVYGKYFEAPHPARATVAVSGLPRGALVEIDAIAIVESETPRQ